MLLCEMGRLDFRLCCTDQVCLGTLISGYAAVVFKNLKRHRLLCVALVALERECTNEVAAVQAPPTCRQEKKLLLLLVMLEAFGTLPFGGSSSSLLLAVARPLVEPQSREMESLKGNHAMQCNHRCPRPSVARSSVVVLE